MSRKRYIFRRATRWYTSWTHIFVLLLMIIGSTFVLQRVQSGEIRPLNEPTPTPTRVPESYSQEAQTHFLAGNLDAAIESYRLAIESSPENGLLKAELARILTYSTAAQTTDAEKQRRYEEALEVARQGVIDSPDASATHAALAFTLDWYSDFHRAITRQTELGEKMLLEAEQEIIKAVTLDETDILAQVYRAEIMIDQQRWDQAQSALRYVLERAPDLWEAHRVNSLYLEYQADYMGSIEALERAVALAPNMTFLYIDLGMAWRNQANSMWNQPSLSLEYYDRAIGYFAQAVALNERLGIKDPLPYLGIGRSYAQQGEFLAASLNMNKALQFDPTNPNVYAQLGMVYRQARNYEDAIKALGCAVRGCPEEVTCDLRGCNPDIDPPITIEKMDLSASTVVYYYTYASLLSGMYVPRHPERSKYCDMSMELVREIKSSQFAEPVVLDILAESEAICADVPPGGEQRATPTPTPDPNYTATPEGEQTAGPTPAFTLTPTPGADLTETPAPGSDS